MGDYVHVDNVYEQYIRAADVLVGNQYNRSPNSPYTPLEGAKLAYMNEGDGPTLGPSDAWGLVGGVRLVAERASFTQKWLVARRARPEVMAALIDIARNGNRDISAHLSPLLLETSGPVHQFLERVKEWNQSRGGEANYLLPQMYPEGSPAHPAWPSGHAIVAGACVTVLKAIFDDEQPIIRPDSPPGKPEKLNIKGPEQTVAGELDKLASNVAFGRNFGGVHYRSDGEHGILLGEVVAVRYLQDHAREYVERFRFCPGFTLTKRNGERICIKPGSVEQAEKLDRPSEPRIFGKSLL